MGILPEQLFLHWFPTFSFIKLNAVTSFWVLFLSLSLSLSPFMGASSCTEFELDEFCFGG